MLFPVDFLKKYIRPASVLFFGKKTVVSCSPFHFRENPALYLYVPGQMKLI
jgi:hypothetical protein